MMEDQGEAGGGDKQDPSNGGVPGPVELGEPLESMLSSLHSEEDGGTGGPPLQGPSLRRAREMCEAVATRAPLVFRPEGDAPVFKRVIHMLFSEDQQKRKAARIFMEAAINEPKDYNAEELVQPCSPGGTYHKWMLEELAKGNPDSLRAWQVVIRILDKLIRQSSGTPTLNALLGIAEKGFKNEELEVRRETFRAWEVLIDNFAKSEAVINNPKRIRLITRPLVANNNLNKMPLAQAKFSTWWHYIQAMGINAPKNADSVVVPFLEFCYGRAGVASSSANPPISPVKKFAPMTSQILEAFAHVLNCEVQNPTLAPLEVKESLISPETLSKHHDAVMNAISEAMDHTDLGSATDVGRFEQIFLVVSNMVHSLQCIASAASSSSKKDPAVDAASATDAFLSCAHGLVSRGGRLHLALALVFLVLDEVRKLPAAILSAPKPTWSVGGTPVMEMLKLTLDPVLVTVATMDQGASGGTGGGKSARAKRQLFSAIEALIKKATVSKKITLTMLEAFMTSLEKVARNISPDRSAAPECVSAWKIAAETLRSHIDKNNGQINQLDSNVGHRVAACEKILEFPLRRLAADSNRSFWKYYAELLRQVSEQVDAIVSARPLEIQRKLCRIMEDSLVSLGDDVTVQHVTNYSKILGSAIIADIPLSSPGDISESLEPIISVFGYLAKAMPRFNKEESRACGQAGYNICSAASALLSGAKAQSLIRMLVESLLPLLCPLLDTDLISKTEKMYEDAVDLMVSNAMNLLQSRFLGAPTADLAHKLKDFLAASMSHPKKNIRTRSQQMWQAMFASSLAVSDIPAEISAILRKSLILSSDSTVSSSSFEEASLGVGGGAADKAGTPVKMFGSFLNKTAAALPADKPASVSSPQRPGAAAAVAKQPDANGGATGSPLRNFRKPGPKRVALEDESTQDFVPITNSAKKRRPLTEHQKEKLLARHDDIPALYSELSRDDSQMGAPALPSQFMSQASVDDESSQAAMDVNAFKNVVAKNKSGSRVSETSDSESNKEVGSSGAEEAVAPTTAGPSDPSHSSSQEDEEESQSVIESLHNSRRRKARTPVKNLMPTAKGGHTPAVQEGGTPKKKRGRPPKNRKLAEAAANDPPEVKVKKLSPEQDNLVKASPVKVIQEQPLVIVPAEEERVSRALHYDDDSVDVIQSSQNPSSSSSSSGGDASDNLSSSRRGRKRKRDSSMTGGLTKLDDNARSDEGSGTTSKSSKPTRRTLPSRTTSSSGTSAADKENLTSSATEQQASQQQQQKGKNTNKYGESPLHLAVKRGDLDKVTSLLKGDGAADVNARDNAGWTPLHESVTGKVPKNILPMLRLLVEAGADVNAKSDDGSTVLHDAARYLSQEVVQFLLDSGADCRVRNNLGKMPVHQASAVNKALLTTRAGSRSPSPTKRSPEKANNILGSPNKLPASSEDSGKEKETASTSPAKSKNATPVSETGPEAEKNEDEAKKKDVPASCSSSLEADLPKVNGETVPENRMHKPSSSHPGNGDSPSSDIPSLPSLLRSPATSSAPKPPTKKSTPILPFGGRGARLLEMSKAKGSSPTSSSSERGPAVSNASRTPLMSPKVSLPGGKDPLSTPTSRQQRPPWEKFQPSPSDASPSASILKKAFSEGDGASPRGSNGATGGGGPPSKRRKVQFKEPCVSDKVEIPRNNWGAGTVDSPQGVRPKQLARFSKDIPLVKSLSAGAAVPGEGSSGEDSSSCGLYHPTPPVADPSSTDAVFPALSDCEDPVADILGLLANQTWQKAAQRSLTENGVSKVGDLARMTALKAGGLKGLKPPNNVATIVEAMKRHEKRREQRKSVPGPASKKQEQHPAPSPAPVVDVTTPEEEERTMQELYERPSPSPTEDPLVLGKEVEEKGEESNKAVSEPPPKESADKDELPTILEAYQKPAPTTNAAATAAATATTAAEKEKEAKKTIETQASTTQTEERQVSEAEVQAAAETEDCESQTEEKSKEGQLKDLLAQIDALEPASVVTVMEKCLSKMRAQV